MNAIERMWDKAKTDASHQKIIEALKSEQPNICSSCGNDMAHHASCPICTNGGTDAKR